MSVAISPEQNVAGAQVWEIPSSEVSSYLDGGGVDQETCIPIEISITPIPNSGDYLVSVENRPGLDNVVVDLRDLAARISMWDDFRSKSQVFATNVSIDPIFFARTYIKDYDPSWGFMIPATQFNLVVDFNQKGHPFFINESGETIEFSKARWLFELITNALNEACQSDFAGSGIIDGITGTETEIPEINETATPIPIDNNDNSILYPNRPDISKITSVEALKYYEDSGDIEFFIEYLRKYMQHEAAEVQGAESEDSANYNLGIILAASFLGAGVVAFIISKLRKS